MVSCVADLLLILLLKDIPMTWANFDESDDQEVILFFLEPFEKSSPGVFGVLSKVLSINDEQTDRDSDVRQRCYDATPFHISE